MVFKVGETVVYPHHGAALIEAIETRTIKGQAREYLVLKVAQAAANPMPIRRTILACALTSTPRGGCLQRRRRKARRPRTA